MLFVKQVKITDMQVKGTSRTLLAGDPMCAPSSVVMSEALISTVRLLHKVSSLEFTLKPFVFIQLVLFLLNFVTGFIQLVLFL